MGEAVCSRDTYQTIEERPQVREIVRHVCEHRPFEKEFVNEVSTTPAALLHYSLSVAFAKAHQIPCKLCVNVKECLGYYCCSCQNAVFLALLSTL